MLQNSPEKERTLITDNKCIVAKENATKHFVCFCVIRSNNLQVVPCCIYLQACPAAFLLRAGKRRNLHEKSPRSTSVAKGEAYTNCSEELHEKSPSRAEEKAYKTCSESLHEQGVLLLLV